jgi:protein-S-isoprenylcysteine O-methyltransferase Ste14
MAVGTPQHAILPAVAAAPAVARARRTRFTPTYWSNIRFLVFGRAVPGVLFGLMGWVQLGKVIGNLQHIPAGAGPGTIAGSIVSPALYTGFCGIPAFLYLTRPQPKARDGRLVARSAAFAGTLMQLVVGTFLGTGPLLYALPPFVNTLSVVVSIVSVSGAIWSLAYLRRSLSIIPEARRLTTGGPYAIVRHPLYLFEIMAAVSVLASSVGVISAVSLLGFVGMQMVRARFEERLLASAFPEYAGYARRTRRLIPFVW